jgi:beta-1,4-mannosyltransferase
MRVLAWPARANRNLNPYNALLSTALEQIGVQVLEWTGNLTDLERVDVLHVHWPEAALNLPDPGGINVVLEAIQKVRARNVRVVWTAHNLRAHAGIHPKLEREFWASFCASLDGVIALSEHSRVALLERHSSLERVPITVIPHGHYRDAYPNTILRDRARALLNLSPEVPVLAFVGQLRAYKGIPELLTAFGHLEADARLLIAGKPIPPEDAAHLEALAARDPRVRLELGFVPDDRLQLFLNAADLIVLPYRQILNSGSALLALSFNRPVLAPAIGGLPELAQKIGGDWLQLFSDDLEANDLRNAFEASRTMRDRVAPLEGFDWVLIAEKTLRFYLELTNR